MASHASTGMSAFRAALLLACGAVALAKRAAPTLDDGVSLMQINRHISRELPQAHKACSDTDAGAFDKEQNSCNAGPDPYNEIPEYCGSYYDDSDFSSIVMCCECGGGDPPKENPCTNCVNRWDGLPDGCHYFPYFSACLNDEGKTYCKVPGTTPSSAPVTSCPASPTGSPTASATPAPSQGTSATGDPHVTNVDGARFDIMKSGFHEFLRLPRRANRSSGSAETEPLLSVLAAVERPSMDECHELYVKQVDVTGGWLNSSGPLRFLAVGDSSDGVRGIMLSVNGSLVDVPALSRDSRVHPFLKVVEPSTPRASHVAGAIQKVPMLTVKLSFSSAILKIDWMHRAVPNGQSLNHLNFQASGLRGLLDGAGMDIGGILGRDDHSEAASLPDGCKPAGADLRVASRATAQEGDFQVITATL